MKREGRRIAILAAALLVLGLVAMAQQTPAASGPPEQTRTVAAAPQPPAGTELTDQSRKTYLLGPDDAVTIHAMNAPDLSDKPFRVDADGELKLPMVGRIHAGGLTAEQLEAEIAKRLKVYLVDPEVTVSLTEFKSQPVSILGEVTTPGVHQLEGQKTLLEILAVAGGLRPDAGTTIKITRRLEYGRIPVPDAVDDPSHQFSIAEINLKAVMEAKSPEYNILIRPHDVLSVPRAQQVYVLGEVNKVGPLPLNEGQSISVLEAVSSSGGMLRTAAASHARILRPVPGQLNRTELAVDVSKIMAGKSEDIRLLAGDIFVIPGSTGKHAVARALEAAVQAGTLVAVHY
ncbi:MAG: polysaccharide biosynthesis/export family protein [Bryobacteraceae bacterium]|jgi:polysaccharide export outer membrane protein